MKKFLKGFLATTMVFAMTAALVGCGGSKGAEQPAGDKDAENAAKETLIMATNAEFPPYEYHEGQSIVGIDAEIGAAIAEKLGYNFQIDDMAFDSIIPAVTSGKASFGMAGMTVTPDRLESVDFSDSYATGIQVVIVKEDSAITSVDDLLKEGAKHSVGVQTGTTCDIYASDDIYGKGLGTIERYNIGADAVQSLATAKIDCVIIDNATVQAFVEANQGLKILYT
ncbi:transporter substrate-binding domain-containing protein, partial [Anaerotignum sp.]|uniref:transporter substrate-binding domain-containing protein n=1 Tax=Anaerotignum sp. TaxID=2039241 RepID=UPI00289D61DA